MEGRNIGEAGDQAPVAATVTTYRTLGPAADDGKLDRSRRDVTDEPVLTGPSTVLPDKTDHPSSPQVFSFSTLPFSPLAVSTSSSSPLLLPQDSSLVTPTDMPTDDEGLMPKINE